ncbi:MAG: hypothetical protein ACRD43_09280 [Pyrinomonadaceae bacterium]
MKFDKGIDKKYQTSVQEALNTIMARGNEDHKKAIGAILESDMLVQVQPVSKVKASGVTGVIDPSKTAKKITRGEMGLLEALGEIYINIAEETIDTGGQRGCEGTFVHEGRHAFDFATMIQSYSEAGINPLGIFDPTLYELELAAHKTAGDYMLCVDTSDFLDEGLQLMILGRKLDNGPCFVDNTGINKRLCDSYGLTPDGNQGPTASQLLGLKLG